MQRFEERRVSISVLKVIGCTSISPKRILVVVCTKDKRMRILLLVVGNSSLLLSIGGVINYFFEISSITLNRDSCNIHFCLGIFCLVSVKVLDLLGYIHFQLAHIIGKEDDGEANP